MITHNPNYPPNYWNALTRAALLLLGLGRFMAQTTEGLVIDVDGHALHSQTPIAPETLARLGLVEVQG